MIILSHRGYWENISEKNTKIAFERSFSKNFGTETDIRDYKNELVISHDIANNQSMRVEQFFDIYKKFNTQLPLALNIKADGLQDKLKKLLIDYKINNYFVFDMAVPDGIIYSKQNFTIFTRQSEYEPTPAYYNLANGIWLDEFLGHWITKDVIQQHLSHQKSICIVSPELHKRDYLTTWQDYHQFENKLGDNKIMLCTDFPENAQEFFNAHN
jgi:glycerophosphoryl diester phosphodiesterase